MRRMRVASFGRFRNISDVAGDAGFAS
jgi:hypothetical protein